MAAPAMAKVVWLRNYKKGQNQRFALQELLRNSRWHSTTLHAFSYTIKKECPKFGTLLFVIKAYFSYLRQAASPASISTGKMIADKSPSFKLSCSAEEIKPTMVGPEEHPISPAECEKCKDRGAALWTDL